MTPQILAVVLDAALQYRASDIHLKAGMPPILRIDGQLRAVSSFAAVKGEELAATLESLLSADQRQQLQTKQELDASTMFEGKVRLRINVYKGVDGLGCAMRLIPVLVPSIESLGLPAIAEKLTHTKSGLVLVAGVTGSGKSTTMAAMVNEINQTQASHIYTIEDPIEFVHHPSRSIITQIEIDGRQRSFASAIRSALRADPNILLIGEMRDPETIRTALTAAETGLLVLSTLHTGSAAKTIQRILAFFEPKEQEAVRIQLAYALRAVLCQQLLPLQTSGRRAFHEIMVNTATIEESILRSDYDKITECMRNGVYDGMCTMDDSIYKAYTTGDIDGETAQRFAIDRDHMERALRGAMLS